MCMCVCVCRQWEVVCQWEMWRWISTLFWCLLLTVKSTLHHKVYCCSDTLLLAFILQHTLTQQQQQLLQLLLPLILLPLRHDHYHYYYYKDHFCGLPGQSGLAGTRNDQMSWLMLSSLSYSITRGTSTRNDLTHARTHTYTPFNGYFPLKPGSATATWFSFSIYS